MQRTPTEADIDRADHLRTTVKDNPTPNAAVELIQINDTFVVKFPKREFVLGDRASAITIAQYYADQHGLPVIEDGKTIYSPPTRDGYAVMSQAEIAQNAAQAQQKGLDNHDEI